MLLSSPERSYWPPFRTPLACLGPGPLFDRRVSDRRDKGLPESERILRRQSRHVGGLAALPAWQASPGEVGNRADEVYPYDCCPDHLAPVDQLRRPDRQIGPCCRGQ